jgi:hypothetical protein
LQTYVRIAQHELALPKTNLLHLDGWYIDADAKPDVEFSMSVLPPQRFGPPELCYSDAPGGDVPGALIRRHGKGSVTYLPWLPEWIYYRDGLPEHRELISRYILRHTKPPIKVEGIGPIEVTVHRQAEGRGDLLIHLVNYSGQRNNVVEQPVPLLGFRIGVQGMGASARSLIDDQPIAIGAPDADGYAWLQVPEIDVFQAILAETSAT